LDEKENVYLRINNSEWTISDDGALKWAPIAIKDNIMQKWEISTCGSKMLEDYVAPYTATCIENLEKNGGVVIWKTNMDEFAMWSSNETSYYWPVVNPHGTNRIPWGSSGGSAVAVAKDLCVAALGTDTGWSVRQPAAMCGIVWMKPTYGRISRYGVQSMASSLDQVGTMTKTVDDAEILLKSVMWFDERDSQSDKRADILEKSNKVINQYKIALPKQCFWEWLDPKIKERVLSVVDKLKTLWVQFDEIDLPILDAGISVYYTLMPAELSTNLSRFDWIRFGHQWNTMEAKDIYEYFAKVRSEWFGEEAKRRILLWTFVLSSANYEWYYLKALKVREKMIQDLDNIFQKYDLILSPTTPEVAWKIWEKVDDPLKMYLADMYTVPANLAWLPAISIPVWTVLDDGDKMPVWLHLMANKWKEDDLFLVGRVVEWIIKN
jgi:aspartyl-tRNA(Asn)/glutamyl-tRNA(Gln) amidotransferase subunit A